MEPIARKDWSPRARRIGRWLALGILKPITVVLRWLGLWPRLIARGMRRMHADFGSYRPGDRDVLVCSYFKSGTNWTMQIALQIAYRGTAEFEHIHDLVPWPEVPVRVPFAVAIDNERLYEESPTGLKIIKTHLARHQLPWSDAARYICVVRDPKDVFVSSYHFVRAVMLGPLMPAPEEWLDLYLSADTPLGSWAEHAAGFWEARNRRNVLFLTYESMRKDPGEAIDRVADFIGVSLDDGERAQVLEKSSFAHMKAITHRFDPAGIGPPWADVRGSMVRRGLAGASAEMLTLDQRRRIDEFWSSELRRIGSDFPYDELYRH